MSDTHDLYRNYSENFAEAKRFRPELQFGLFEQLYALFLSKLDHHARIADVGCGKGEWLLWLKEKGFRSLEGFDFSEEDLSYLRKSAPEMVTHAGNAIELLKDRTEEFDVVHAKDLIEHLPKANVLEFLKVAEKALKPGGELWILTFNAQSPFSTATRYGDFTHESGFTPMSMVQVLRSTGFESFIVKGVHVCPKGIKGRVRVFIGSIVYGFSRFLIALRHGSSTSIEGVDLYTAKPDLWIVAKKR